MDYGKYKYELQKKEAEARKKQKTIDVKEIKFRPNTDIHDYEVKMRSVTKFLDHGDKVKIRESKPFSKNKRFEVLGEST